MKKKYCIIGTGRQGTAAAYEILLLFVFGVYVTSSHTSFTLCVVWVRVCVFVLLDTFC